jgi:hypothetical protein
VIQRLFTRAFALWTTVAVGIGRVTSFLLGALLFYGVITPVALLTRSLGRDALRLKPLPPERSYWLEREPAGPTPASMTRPF